MTVVTHTRQARTMAAGPYQPVINSFKLHLNAEGKSPKTVRVYVESTQWFAAAHLLARGGKGDWSAVTADDIRIWMVSLLERYTDSYANNQYRALQQFFRWYSDEEDVPSPMLRLKPPKVGIRVVPVFTEEELKSLSKSCSGKTFADRRDKAIIDLFKATGIRLAEMAGIVYDPDRPDRSDLDMDNRELRVHGKGRRDRIVKFDYDAARSIDRYLRLRGTHARAHSPKLWLGMNNRQAMTPDGIYQMIARRGQQVGVVVHPHKFRHHFSHSWLDRGGNEGDLMELNGWSSPQMLQRYGASARNARARRTYDRIMNEDK